MRIDIMTLFPDSLGDVLSESILGRAQERGFIRIEAHQIRDYTASKQCQVDDYPYGGGGWLAETSGESTPGCTLASWKKSDAWNGERYLPSCSFATASQVRSGRM